jgi:hypothetical protein
VSQLQAKVSDLLPGNCNTDCHLSLALALYPLHRYRALHLTTRSCADEILFWSALALPRLCEAHMIREALVMSCPVQCSAVQCSAVQCSAVQCSAVQCSAVQCSAVQRARVCAPAAVHPCRAVFQCSQAPWHLSLVFVALIIARSELWPSSAYLLTPTSTALLSLQRRIRWHKVAEVAAMIQHSVARVCSEHRIAVLAVMCDLGSYVQLRDFCHEDFNAAQLTPCLHIQRYYARACTNTHTHTHNTTQCTHTHTHTHARAHTHTQHNTTQHNTTQHNTTQHNTTQHNTTQHNTTQHNTTQRNAT